jgi:hypothetical protein
MFASTCFYDHIRPIKTEGTDPVFSLFNSYLLIMTCFFKTYTYGCLDSIELTKCWHSIPASITLLPFEPTLSEEIVVFDVDINDIISITEFKCFFRTIIS